MSGRTVTPPDACAVLGTAAAALAGAGREGLRPALETVVRDLGLRSAVLRDGGTLVAVAGDVVHAVPSRRGETGPEAVVELPVPGTSLALTVVGARPSTLPLLRAVCAVLALALRGPAAVPLPLALIDAADADAADAADDLHDGVVQELVYARLAADAAARGGDAASARDAVQAALQSLRRSLWMLRPRGATDGGLTGALAQLSDRLVEMGRPALDVEVDGTVAAALGPQACSVAYRLVQGAARGGEAVAVRLDRDGSLLRLHVRPAPAPLDRWTARARALGAALTSDPAGGVVLSVPALPTTPTDTEAT